MDNNERNSRRRFLKGAAGLGVVGLAGCISGDNGGEEPSGFRMGSSAGGTMDTALAYERAVNEHAENVDFSTVETRGYVGTTYEISQDNVDGGWIDTNTMTKAQDGRDMFEEDPVEKLPWQGFGGFPYSIYMMARDGTGIETFDDLAGARVYPAQPGYSTRATTLEVWENTSVYEEMEIVDMDVDDAPGAISEGRVDAMIAYGTPGVGNTGWAVEYDNRADVHYVQHTDELVQAIEEFPGAGISYHQNPKEKFNWSQDIGADEIVTWDLQVTVTFHPDASEDAVYELMRVAHEHSDTAREAEKRFYDFQSAEDLTWAAVDDYPFHPGVAQYLQDQDVWDNNWVIGETGGDYA